MKMLVTICPENRREDIRALIARHAVHAYSELRDVTGEGSTGKRLGSRVWPDRSVLFFTVVPDDQLAELTASLRECAKTLFPEEGMRAFVLPAESVL